jgi:hypothetical protein
MAANLGQEGGDLLGEEEWFGEKHSSNATEVDGWKEVLQIDVEYKAPANVPGRIAEDVPSHNEPMSRAFGFIHRLEYLIQLALNDLERRDWS